MAMSVMITSKTQVIGRVVTVVFISPEGMFLEQMEIVFGAMDAVLM